jgi:hypothetical protein
LSKTRVHPAQASFFPNLVWVLNSGGLGSDRLVAVGDADFDVLDAHFRDDGDVDFGARVADQRHAASLAAGDLLHRQRHFG